MPHRRANDIQIGVFSASGWLIVALVAGGAIDYLIVDAALRVVG